MLILISVDPLTSEAKRKLDALHAMNNSWNEQLKNTEESDPAYQSILKTMEENRNKAQAIVNNPALWAQPASVAPAPAQHPTVRVVKAVQDEIASGTDHNEIRRKISRIPDPQTRAAAQQALDNHTKGGTPLGPTR